MPRPVSLRFELALAVCVVLLAAIVVWQVGAAMKRPLDAEEMKIDVADLGSYAAEGDLLAQQRNGATITRSYSAVQSEMWRDKIEDIVRKYEKREPAAELKKPFAEIHALTRRLLAAADRVARDFAKDGTASDATAELQRVESDARQLKLRLVLSASEGT
jgi:hypothetical protein